MGSCHVCTISISAFITILLSLYLLETASASVISSADATEDASVPVSVYISFYLSAPQSANKFHLQNYVCIWHSKSPSLLSTYVLIQSQITLLWFNLLIWFVWHKCKIYSKLDRVAPLIGDPPPANSTTMHSRVVCQDWNLCLGEQTWSGNIALTCEPMMQYQNSLGFIIFLTGPI